MLPPNGITTEGREISAAAPSAEGSPANLGSTDPGSISPSPANLGPNGLAETSLMSISSQLAEEIAAIPGYIADACASPADEIAEDTQDASAPAAEEAAANTAAPRMQEIQEAARCAETIPAPVAEAIGTSSNAFAQQAGEAVEIVASPVAGESTGQAGWMPVRTAVETNESLSLRVAVADREPIPPAFSFLSFYGLREQPFEVTPDPAYLYLSPVHREALISLSQGVQNLRGFMALVAGPGMGKTTLLNRLIEELRETARTVFLFQTQCNSREMLRYHSERAGGRVRRDGRCRHAPGVERHLVRGDVEGPARCAYRG